MYSTAGTYDVTVTDANGCTMNDTTLIDTFVVYQGTEVCMVTVSSTNRLLIVWENVNGCCIFILIWLITIAASIIQIGTLR